MADVVYVHLNDARNAIEQYNNRELDGKPLSIELVTKIPIAEKLRLDKKPPVPFKCETPVPLPVAVKGKRVVKRLKHTSVQSVQQPTSPVQPASKTTKILNTIQSSPKLVSNNFANISKTFITNQLQTQQPTQLKTLSKEFATINQHQTQNLKLKQNIEVNKQQISTIQPKSHQAIVSNESSKIIVDTTVIHQALFNSSKSAANNNVTFTVKI